MNHLNVTVIAASIGLIFSACISAQALSDTSTAPTVAGGMERSAERQASQEALGQTRDTNYEMAKDDCKVLESGDQEHCEDEAQKQYSK